MKAKGTLLSIERRGSGMRARGGELVVFLRGVNVGGHRRFRPSVLARKLSAYGVVNVGATGTFVVRKPGSREKFRAALLRELPFEAVAALCAGADLLRMMETDPFAGEAVDAGMVQFVSILASANRARPKLPVEFPAEGEWLVRVIGAKGPFVFGMYRRHMKTIGYLGQVDRLFGAAATTRNWKTMMAVAGVLQRGAGQRVSGSAT